MGPHSRESLGEKPLSNISNAFGKLTDWKTFYPDQFFKPPDAREEKAPTNEMSPSGQDRAILNCLFEQPVQLAMHTVQEIFQWIQLVKYQLVKLEAIMNIVLKLSSSRQINAIPHQLDTKYPINDKREMLSKVRRWFRKKREELGSKVISIFQSQFCKVLVTRHGRETMLQRIDRLNIDEIIEQANLPFTTRGMAEKFSRSKIRSLLTRKQQAAPRS